MRGKVLHLCIVTFPTTTSFPDNAAVFTLMSKITHLQLIKNFQNSPPLQQSWSQTPNSRESNKKEQVVCQRRDYQLQIQVALKPSNGCLVPSIEYCGIPKVLRVPFYFRRKPFKEFGFANFIAKVVLPLDSGINGCKHSLAKRRWMETADYSSWHSVGEA